VVTNYLTVFLRLIFAVALLPFLSGCGLYVQNYAISKPEINKPKISIRENGWFETDGTIFFISPANPILLEVWTDWFYPISSSPKPVPPEKQRYVSSYYNDEYFKKGVRTPSFFILEIFFGVGEKSVTFQPSKTVVHTTTGRYTPSELFDLPKPNSTNRFWGHRPYWRLCRTKTSDAMSPFGDTKPIDPTRQLQFAGQTEHCLAIKFPTSPPDPRGTFDVEINGLFIGDRPTPIRIKYTPGTVTERHA